MLAEFIGHLLVGIVRVVDGILGVFGAFSALERKMNEGSRVGESPMEAENRRWWERVGEVWLVIALLLLAIAAVLGVAVEWW